MNPKRKKRLYFVLFIVLGVGAATVLLLNAMQENLLYFFSPSQIAEGEAPANNKFRMGGLVKTDSLRREDDGLTVHFVVTDTAKDVAVSYTGILPDLFREGQGIVALGRMNTDGRFMAEEVLAKHDENYMPPEVAEALESAGAISPHGTSTLSP